MAVLVTGGAGYIGAHMVIELIRRREQVVVLDNLSSGSRQAVDPAAEFIKGDISDRILVDRILKTRSINAVLHFAGSILVPESLTDPLHYYGNNTGATRELIDACVCAGVKNFVFSSTAAVYGTPAQVPVSENAAPSPISPYGSSKLMSEWMLRDAAAAHNMRFAILRYFNVAGADPEGRCGQSSPAATHLIKVAAQTACGLRPDIAIYGTDYSTPDGTCIRDYIHVSDLVNAHGLALDYLRHEKQNLLLNCGYGRGFSVKEVINAVRRISGRKFVVNETGRRPGDPPILVADSGQIRKLLGWKPLHDDLLTIIAHAISWERRIDYFAAHARIEPIFEARGMEKRISLGQR